MEENETKVYTAEDFAAVADERLAEATAEVVNRYRDVLRRLGDAE